jgi:heparan-alpha-glucosaminide N-acetyltransferase
MFIFIMGVSIALSFKSIANKSINQADDTRKDSNSNVKLSGLVFKIARRTSFLFLLGILTSNHPDDYFSTLRISGVLQRFSISYLVCSLIELIYFKRNYFVSLDMNALTDNRSNYNANFTNIFTWLKVYFLEIALYPIQWIIVFSFILLWTLTTFYLPVEGCITGYLGPGIDINDRRRKK